MKSTGDENIDNFIKHVREKAAEYGVKVFLRNQKRIKLSKGNYCAGYFSDSDFKIVVAIDVPLNNWVSVLAHEFSHMEQWISNVKMWDNLNIYNTDSCSEFFEWLEGKYELHEELITYHMRRVCEMELNCEKRTVEMIKKFKLPINIPNYIQKANTYIWFYSVVRQKRQWEGTKAKSIYEIKQIASIAPKNWVKDPFNVPEKFIKALDKYYF